ncbi:cation transporting ATPase C-terminal domain-containing protein [Siccirubricoccus deserti]
MTGGSGDLRYAQTAAFATLALFQICNLFSARPRERSAFVGIFANCWLWAAVGFPPLVHAVVIYLPFLQVAFSTVALGAATGWSARRWQARCCGCGS